jgi:hypothetical protein
MTFKGVIMKSLESIIEGGLYSLEDDTIDIPQEEVTSDEYTEVVLDGINENATVEQFLAWHKRSIEHFHILQSLGLENASFAAEGFNVKDMFAKIKEAIKRMAEAIINFIRKVVNHIRSIGIDKKCEFLRNNRSKKAEIDKYMKNNEKALKDKSFFVPEFVGEFIEIFSDLEEDMTVLSKDIQELTLQQIKESDDGVSKLYEKSKENAKRDPDNKLDGIQMVNVTFNEDMFSTDAQKAFVYKYEEVSKKMMKLILNLKKDVKEDPNGELKEKYTIMANTLRKLHSLLLKSTSVWITCINFTYSVAQKALGKK